MKNLNIPQWTIKLNGSSHEDVVDCIESLRDHRGSFWNSGCKPFGIVYLVTFSDGSSYIGKKNLYSERKVSKGKKELGLMTDKRGSKKKTIVKESNWKTYFGSFNNKQLLESLKNGDLKVSKRYIIDIAYTKSQLTYLEAKYQFVNGVIEPTVDTFKNDNILGKFYRRSLTV